MIKRTFPLIPAQENPLLHEEDWVNGTLSNINEYNAQSYRSSVLRTDAQRLRSLHAPYSSSRVVQRDRVQPYATAPELSYDLAGIPFPAGTKWVFNSHLNNSGNNYGKIFSLSRNVKVSPGTSSFEGQNLWQFSWTWCGKKFRFMLSVRCKKDVVCDIVLRRPTDYMVYPFGDSIPSPLCPVVIGTFHLDGSSDLYYFETDDIVLPQTAMPWLALEYEVVGINKTSFKQYGLVEIHNYYTNRWQPVTIVPGSVPAGFTANPNSCNHYLLDGIVWSNENSESRVTDFTFGPQRRNFVSAAFFYEMTGPSFPSIHNTLELSTAVAGNMMQGNMTNVWDGTTVKQRRGCPASTLFLGAYFSGRCASATYYSTQHTYLHSTVYIGNASNLRVWLSVVATQPVTYYINIYHNTTFTYMTLPDVSTVTPQLRVTLTQNVGRNLTSPQDIDLTGLLGFDVSKNKYIHVVISGKITTTDGIPYGYNCMYMFTPTYTPTTFDIVEVDESTGAAVGVVPGAYPTDFTFSDIRSGEHFYMESSTSSVTTDKSQYPWAVSDGRSVLWFGKFKNLSLSRNYSVVKLTSSGESSVGLAPSRLGTFEFRYSGSQPSGSFERALVKNGGDVTFLTRHVANQENYTVTWVEEDPLLYVQDIPGSTTGALDLNLASVAIRALYSHSLTSFTAPSTGIYEISYEAMATVYDHFIQGHQLAVSLTDPTAMENTLVSVNSMLYKLSTAAYHPSISDPRLVEVAETTLYVPQDNASNEWLGHGGELARVVNSYDQYNETSSRDPVDWTFEKPGLRHKYSIFRLGSYDTCYIFDGNKWVLWDKVIVKASVTLTAGDKAYIRINAMLPAPDQYPTYRGTVRWRLVV